MALYPKFRTTNKGRELVGEANAKGKALVFTRVVLGDGTQSGSIDAMTSVISPKMDLPKTNGTNDGNGQYTIYATVDNSTLTSGFYAREVGVYAKVDNGTEQLFAYTNGGNFVDYIPDKTIPIDAQVFKLHVVIGDAENVTILVNNETYATVLDLSVHNTAADAHSNLFGQYIKKSGGTMTGDLKVLNKLISDNSQNAASTKFVRDLLNTFMTKGEVNFSTFKNAMAGAVEYDYSDPNRWWRKEPDGLIIQGGKRENLATKSTVTLPLNVNQILGVWPVDVDLNSNPLFFGTDNYTKSSFDIAGRRVDMVNTLWFRWIAFCI